MKSYRYTIRLPADLRQRLNGTATVKGAKESDLVRHDLETAPAKHVDLLMLYQQERKLDLIGMVHGASPDLSTNAEHFEGFGDF